MLLRVVISLFVLCAMLSAVEPPTALSGDKPRLGVVLDDGAFDPSQGVPVRGVAPGSSAVALGIQAGDLLASFNGKAIHSAADLLAALGEAKTGDTVTIEVVRAGAKHSLTGKLIPPATSATLQQELNDVRAQLADMRVDAAARTREPSLAELIRELQFLQEQFPRAAAEFKKIYPNGEFSIVIRITSDKTAEHPVDLMQLTDPKAVPPVMPAVVPPAPAVPPAPEK